MDRFSRVKSRVNSFKCACILFDVDQMLSTVDRKNILCEENQILKVGDDVPVKWGEEDLSAKILFLSSKSFFILCSIFFMLQLY